APDAVNAAGHPVAANLLESIFRRVDEAGGDRGGGDAGAERRAAPRACRERELPRERPGRSQERDEPRHPGVPAPRDLEGLALEEEDFLKVFLQTARSLEVALERRGRRRIGVRDPVLLPVGELLRERLADALFDDRDDGREALRERRLRLRHAR